MLDDIRCCMFTGVQPVITWIPPVGVTPGGTVTVPAYLHRYGGPEVQNTTVDEKTTLKETKLMTENTTAILKKKTQSLMLYFQFCLFVSSNIMAFCTQGHRTGSCPSRRPPWCRRVHDPSWLSKTKTIHWRRRWKPSSCVVSSLIDTTKIRSQDGFSFLYAGL